MPNKNYQKGVRFERERIAYYRDIMGHDTTRASGSHGNWDIITVNARAGIVNLIQCKVCGSEATARRYLARFREHPPLTPMAYVHQTMECKVHGSKEVLSVTV